MAMLPPQPRSATTLADGTATIPFTLPLGGVVHQVSVSMATAPIGASCGVFFDGYLVSPLVPTGDAAGGEPPIRITAEDTLSVVWTGCTPGVIGTALFIYDDGT